MYCETLLQVLLGKYCKRFYWIPLFTILLLFYVFEVGKAKSATHKCPNDINTEWDIPENSSSFYFTPGNSISLTLPPAFSLCLFFFHYSLCTIISDCNHPFNTSTFTHTVSQEYIIATENTYLNGVF